VCAYKQYAAAPVEARVLRYLKWFAMRTAEKSRTRAQPATKKHEWS